VRGRIEADAVECTSTVADSENGLLGAGLSTYPTEATGIVYGFTDGRVRSVTVLVGDTSPVEVEVRPLETLEGRRLGLSAYVHQTDLVGDDQPSVVVKATSTDGAALAPPLSF
jgi:hypothetical protein